MEARKKNKVSDSSDYADEVYYQVKKSKKDKQGRKKEYENYYANTNLQKSHEYVYKDLGEELYTVSDSEISVIEKAQSRAKRAHRRETQKKTTKQGLRNTVSKFL